MTMSVEAATKTWREPGEYAGRLSLSRWRWCALLPLVCCVSCSGSTGLYSVEGKVLYQDQPLAGVLVVFHPKADDLQAIPSTGYTGNDGAFTLVTQDKAGAPPGEYLVTFTCLQEQPAKNNGPSQASPLPESTLAPAPQLVDRFDGAYAEKSASKFPIEVKAGQNRLEPFHLK